MKTIAFFLTWFFIAFGALNAQTPQTLWSWIHAVTDDIDNGKCVRQTDDEGFIITGSADPLGLTSFTDVMLVKTDDSGVVSWSRFYDFGFFEEGMSVEQTADGGFIIGGIRMYGSYPFIEDPVSDALLIRTNRDGDTLWTRSFDMGGNEYCTSVKQTSDGGFIMTGAIQSDACGPTWEVNELTEPDPGMTWLAKTDADGHISWSQSWIFYSNGNDVIQTSDGGYMITGCIYQEKETWQSDVLMIKTDATGWNLWEKKIGTGNYELGFNVRETADAYVISGQTKTTGEDYNGLAIKTDLTGNVLWMKEFGNETMSDALFAVDVTDEGYYFSGSTNGTWWVTAFADMWALKTDTQGDVLWEKVFDVRNCDISYSGILCCDGGYTLTGMTSYGFGGDLWLAKVSDGPAGIAEKDIENSLELVVYPNPATEVITVRYQMPVTRDASRVTYLQLFSIDGKMVFQIEIPEEEFEIDISDFEAGMYFVRMQVGEVAVVKKLVVSY